MHDSAGQVLAIIAACVDFFPCPIRLMEYQSFTAAVGTGVNMDKASAQKPPAVYAVGHGFNFLVPQVSHHIQIIFRAR